MCTYKKISVKIAIDRSTRGFVLPLFPFFVLLFFGQGSVSFVISIFEKRARDLGLSASTLCRKASLAQVVICALQRCSCLANGFADF